MISAEEAIKRLIEGNKLYVGAIYRIEDGSLIQFYMREHPKIGKFVAA